MPNPNSLLGREGGRPWGLHDGRNPLEADGPALELVDGDQTDTRAIELVLYMAVLEGGPLLGLQAMVEVGRNERVVPVQGDPGVGA